MPGTPEPRNASLATEPTLPEPKPSSRNRDAVTGTPSSLPPAIASSSVVAGVKRPAASLLPAFEPLSSSPALPRPSKRQNTGHGGLSAVSNSEVRLKYPTPVPTSSTGFLSSSPPRRPGLGRSITATSEREPLGAVPSVELPQNGEPLLMGRSSNSSHFQLSSNRLVSRIHVKARFIATSTLLEPNKIEIICNGWNGIKLHCQGRTWELFKGDSFTSETEGTDIMLDVLDARVMIQWPRRDAGSSGGDGLSSLSDSSWDDSPRRAAAPGSLQSSPLRRTMRIRSPESPTPGHLSSSQRLQALFPETAFADEQSIQIYEDEPELPEIKGDASLDVNVSMRTEATVSFSSDLSDLDDNDENNPDEENDPLVHSFGPFGANISGRFANISTRSPKIFKSPKARDSPSGLGITARRQPAKAEAISPQRHQRRVVPCEPLIPLKSETPIKPEPGVDTKETTPAPVVEIDPSITNHVVNQLAFSRLSSTPLTTIMQNLPDKEGLAKEVLRAAIEANAAIGIIKRQGKDAAGKALESEYYYVPENDDDENRRAAIVDGLRKPSLRNCRKQHKQYYWKRPKTP